MFGRSSKGSFTWQLTREDLQDRLSTDVAAACAAIKQTAVLTVHGDADADVPVRDAHKIAAAVQVGCGSDVLKGILAAVHYGIVGCCSQV